MGERAWELNEAYFDDGYSHRHRNVYDRAAWSARLNATLDLFASAQSREFVGALTGRECGGETTEAGLSIWVIPAFLSIAPAMVTLVRALLTRQVLVSLVAGIWCGSFFVNGYNPASSLLRVFDTYLVEAMAGKQQQQPLIPLSLHLTTCPLPTLPSGRLFT